MSEPKTDGPAQSNLARRVPARWWIGLHSFLKIFLVPLGNWLCGSIDHLSTAETRAKGLVIVLPGIEGRSSLNLDISRGLVDGGVPFAVEVHDWTTGWLFCSLYHLRSTTWHARQAARLVQRITDYQDAFPGRPVVLVGHSGGAALTLEALPLLEDRQITAAILLAIAVSPGLDPTPALQRTQQGMWSLYSPFDWLQLGLGTLAVGTFDGKHTFSAGMIGFRRAGSHDDELPDDDLPPFREVPYRFSMMRSWNFGGHHGWANRLYSAESLAPLVLEACSETPR